MIKLVRVERASDLRPFMPSDALQIGYEELSEEQEDVIAEFEQQLRDSGDIWRDLEPVQQRQALKDMYAHVATLEASGLIVAVGTDSLRLRTRDTNQPFTMEVLHVVISKAEEPKLFALRDKTTPVRFV